MKHSIESLFAALDERPWMGRVLAVVWIALLSWLVAWLFLGGIGLVDETEPLFAEAARQMTVTGDWITPYFNGVTRFDKPPLVYWLMAFAYQTVGVNEWSVRFPSALAITGLTGLGFYTLRRFGVPRPAEGSASSLTLWFSALIGSAAIALNPQTFLWSRTGVSDMLLSGCIGSALLAFFCGYAQPDRPQVQSRWYLAFYILSALAVLAKGPVGIVIPGMIIVAFLIYMGNWRTVLREMRLLRGALLFLAIALPWFILVIAANGEAYIDSFFGYHNFERFTRVVNRHWAPWYFYFAVVFAGFLPWSVHLPVAMARLRFWQWQQWRQQPRSSHLGLFALIWFVVIFVFFTIAVTKLPSYTIPLLPAAGILVGLFWSEQMTRSRTTRSAQISHWANLVIFSILAAASFYSPNWLGNDPEMPDLPQLIQQSHITVWAGIAWTIAALAALVLLLRRQGRWIWTVNLLGFVAFLLVGLIPAAVIIDSQRQLPLRQLAAEIVQVQQPAEPVIMIGFSKPSLVFYTHRRITYLPEADEAIKDLRKIADQENAANTMLLIGRSVKLREAGLTPQHYQPIDQASVYQLVRMQRSDVSKLEKPDE